MACGSIALISASIIIVSASSLHLIRTLVIGFGAPTCIIQDALESLFFMIFFFSFSASTQLAGSQFPDQRLNPGHGSESTKSFTTGPLGNSLKGLNYICKDPITSGQRSLWEKRLHSTPSTLPISGRED